MKKANYQIKTKDGPKEVSGVSNGTFGVHGERGWWTVTELTSGLAVHPEYQSWHRTRNTKAQACKFATLLSTNPPFPWWMFVEGQLTGRQVERMQDFRIECSRAIA
tara:strand:+ start:3494 stop:3811 length:318 start_codon:yes stop_codon:yes gene_type:complete